MNVDVSKFMQHCLVCQQAKFENVSPVWLLQPLPIPVQIWKDVAMDFIIRLPNSLGFTVIMMVVDRLSKYGHFATLKTYYNSRMVAEVFM